jgi:hypothetical protein
MRDRSAETAVSPHHNYQSTSHYSDWATPASDRVIVNELKITRKEEVVSEYYLSICVEGRREPMKISVGIDGLRIGIWTRVLPNLKQIY